MTSAPKIHGKEMFALVWESSVQLFMSCLSARELFQLPGGQESKVIQKIKKGITVFARVCTVYGMSDVFNNLVIAMCKCLSADLEEICAEAKDEAAAAAFAKTRRAQILAGVIFHLVVQYGDSHLADGWTNVVKLILRLRLMSLLPPSLIAMADFTNAKNEDLPSLRQAAVETSPKPSGGAGVSGLFKSALSIFYAQEDRAAKSDAGAEEQNWCKIGRDAVENCLIGDLLSRSRHYQPSSLSYLVNNLIVVSTYGFRPTVDPSSLDTFDVGIVDQNAAVFCLEKLVDVVEYNQSRLDDKTITLWPAILQHFTAAIQATTESSYYVERLLVNIMSLPARLARTDTNMVLAMRLLSLVLNLPVSVLQSPSLAQRVLTGAFRLARDHADGLSRAAGWDTIFRLLLKFRSHSVLCVEALEIVR
jgi:hypothetical protein